MISNEGVYHTVEFQIGKKTVKDAGSRGDDKTTLPGQKDDGIDDNEGIENGIDAANPSGGINHRRDQCDIAEALNVNVKGNIREIFR